MADRKSITEALMRFMLPNTYGEPSRGAPNPFTPPLWRDQRNPDDPLSEAYRLKQQGLEFPNPQGIDPFADPRETMIDMR